MYKKCFTYIVASASVLIVDPVAVVDAFEAELRASGFQFALTTTTDFEQPVPICFSVFSLENLHYSARIAFLNKTQQRALIAFHLLTAA